METYQQIHDFTPTGAKRFAAFLTAEARPDVSAEACRMECLGVMEDNLNGSTAAPLSWELGAFESATGKPATFTAELVDLIVETVTPAE
jgi:hypothetical protein